MIKIELTGEYDVDATTDCILELVEDCESDNIFIEGDNIDALKLLQEDYKNKIKMIYIDPPYNTGKTKKQSMYPDKFTHEEWLSMMYPRLKLARELLRDDGVIFISIDDREQHHLRMLCDRIFGEGNFVGCFVWKARAGKDHTAKYISPNHENVFVFAKHINCLEFQKDVRITSGGKYSDQYGTYKREQIRQWGTNDLRIDRPTMFFPVTAPDGSQVLPIKDNGDEGCWRISKKRMKEALSANMIDFVFDEKSQLWSLHAKKYDGKITKTAYSSILDSLGSSARGTLDLKSLFGKKIFDTTKPCQLIKFFIWLSGATSNDLILDFFSGSSTTAHAVMQLNAEDGGNRKFIMVQIPEKCDETKDAFKAGYKTIADIGKERIRRAAKKIKEECLAKGKEPPQDLGFKVFRVKQ